MTKCYGVESRVRKRMLSNNCGNLELGVVVQACNPSTWEVEAGGWRLHGQAGLKRKILCQETKQNKKFLVAGCSGTHL
jgi:hypothetical protein